MSYQVQSFDSISDDVVALAGVFPCTLSPSYEHLAQFASFAEVNLDVTAIFEETRNVALICCFISRERVGGQRLLSYKNFGTHFFDYTRLNYDEGCLDALLGQLREDAATLGADCVLLRNVLLHGEDVPQYGSSYLKRTCYYDAHGEAVPYDSLLRKKSVKRHVNKCRRELGYDCVNLVDTEISGSEIDQLGALHKETRAFHDTESAFFRKETYREYSVALDNRVLTKLVHDGEIVACHYGLRFGDQMIWHTPVINIKYLEYSPLEVLLFESITFCRDNGIYVFDLGIGDEPYKKRFSNRERMVYDILIPVSLKAHFARAVKDLDYRVGVSRFIANLKQATISYLDKSVPTLRSRYSCYEISCDIEPSENALQFLPVQDFSGFVDLSRSIDLPAEKQHYQNYREGSWFTRIADPSGQILAYAWQNDSAKLEWQGLPGSLVNPGSSIIWHLSLTEEGKRVGLAELLDRLRTSSPDRKLRVLARKGDDELLLALKSAGCRRASMMFL